MAGVNKCQSVEMEVSRRSARVRPKNNFKTKTTTKEEVDMKTQDEPGRFNS